MSSRFKTESKAESKTKSKAESKTKSKTESKARSACIFFKESKRQLNHPLTSSL